MAQHVPSRSMKFLLISFAFVFALGWANSIPAMAEPDADAPSVITIRSFFEYPANPANPADQPMEQIWLAGFSTAPEKAPLTLGLAWAEEPAAWLPLWYLQLHTDQGLLVPAGDGRKINTKPALGTEYINLASLMPERGVTYETVLSFDAETGALSIWIKNTNRDTVVHRQSVYLAPFAGELNPTAGVVMPDKSFQTFAALQSYDRFIPQAATWGLAEIIDGVPQNIVLRAIDRAHSDDMAIRLDKGGARTGQFNFYSEKDGRRTPVASISAAGDDEPHIVPVERLPFGHSQLVMEYEHDGQVWLTQTQNVRMGWIEAATAAPRYDAETETLESSVAVYADGPMPGASLTVEAELFELSWDAAGQTYRSVSHGTFDIFDGTLTLAKQPTELPVAIPTTGEPTVWHVQYRLATEPDILAGAAERNHLVGTFDGARTAAGPPAVPLVIAHRGASGTMPENTIEAFEEAIRIGVDFVEIDVYHSRDRELVILHDSTVNRTTSGAFQGSVSALTLEQLKTLDAGSWKSPEFAGAQIPTLRETLLTTKDRALLLIEGKGAGIERDTAALVSELNMADQVVYQSFDPGSVRQFRRLMPEVRAGLLFGNPGITSDFDRAATLLTHALSVDASVVAVAHPAVSPAFVRYVQQGGLDVWTWTVNSETDMRRVLNAGVDGIITDYPQRLNDMLAATK